MTRQTRYLSVAEVVTEQERQLANYAGGLPGIRDEGQLKAAVELPAMTFGGEPLLKSPAAIASGYLTYLVRDHVFEQGNKRIGLASAIIFLAVNGHRVSASNEALTNLVMTMASVGDGRESVEAFFDANIETCEPMSYEDASRWMHGAFAPTFIELAK
jgi:death-on-curing protein